MATIADIIAQQKAAVSTLDSKIYDCIGAKNAGGLTDAESDDLDQTIHSLMVERQAVFVQAYNAAWSSADMDAALTALAAATTDMTTAAAKMTTATTMIANADALITASDKVVSALKS